jgi:hypothetical protein
MNTLKTEVQQQHVRVVLAVLLAIGACMGAEAHPGGHGHDHEHDDEPSGASEVRVPVRRLRPQAPPSTSTFCPSATRSACGGMSSSTMSSLTACPTIR